MLKARKVTLAFKASPKLEYTGDLASPSKRTTSREVARNKLTTTHNATIAGIKTRVSHGTLITLNANAANNPLTCDKKEKEE